MRLILLPVTTQRSLLYCQKLSARPVRSTPRLDDRIAAKAAKVWDGFENSDKKWKLTIVRWIGKLLDTIPFEENCLKTLPPRNTWMRQLQDNHSPISEKQAIRKEIADKLAPIELIYPSTSVECPDLQSAKRNLSKLAASALKTHRKQMVMCAAGLPLTIPFAINPFIPNFPGFYLIYRLWSNWKALKAAQHLNYLLKYEQIVGKILPELDQAYKSLAIPENSENSGSSKSHGAVEPVIKLQDNKNDGTNRAEETNKTDSSSSSAPPSTKMSFPLADAINKIFNDTKLYGELQQAIRQTSS